MRRFVLSRRELAFAGAALALIAAVSVAAFLFLAARVETTLTAHQAAVVDSEIRYLQTLDAEGNRRELARFIARRTASPNDDLPIHALVDKDGAYLAGDVDWPKALIADGHWRPIETFRRSRGEAVSGFGRAVRLSDGATVLIGRDKSGLDKVQTALAEAILLTLASLVLIGAATVAVLNRVVLGRIDNIVTTARRIIAGDFHERIPVRGQTDELDRLSGTLNLMLGANEAHIERMRIVTDAVAHDLRLPLQRVKAHLERAHTAQSGDEAARILAMAEAEIDQTLATFNALLEITRAETGVGSDMFDDVDLEAVVRDVVELFEPVAEDKDQKLRARTRRAVVRGHDALLRQALGNLIQNALKFSQEGAAITVEIAPDKRIVSLTVQDNGPGIPASDRASVLRPFGRLSRDKDIDGRGLGLALVAACAKLHHGELLLESAEPGLRAVLTLPRADA